MADPNQIEQQAALNKMLETANKLGQEYFGLLSSQHDVMSSMFSIGSNAMDNHAESINGLQDALDSLTKSQQSTTKSVDDQERALKSISGSAGQTTGIIEKLNQKLTKLGAAYVMVNTLAKTFSFLKTAGGSALNVITTIAGSIFRLGLSLLTLPIGIINDLFAEAQTGGSNEFRRTLEEIRKQFGDLSRNESRAIVDSFRNIRGELANTGLSSYRILGNMAERLKFVMETAQHMGVAFSLIRQQLVNNAEAVAAYVKGLGLTEEGQKALANRAVATGTSITEIGRQMTNYAYQVGEAFGFNGKQISREVGGMMGDIDNFGNMSIQTLTNVAVYARKLGVEVKALTKVIGAFDNFDKAAESVAQLSQAFGLQIDTFAMVQEQDPAARIEMLRKSFFAAGRSIESMTRQERALLATQTGLEQETLSLVFSQKSASTSYADIQRKSEQARKHQLTQAEAMEKLSNSIERLVKDGQSLQGGLFDILFAGFASGIRRSGPFREMMRHIRQLMREVFRVGREMGRMFVELFPGVRQLFTSIGTYLSPRGIGRQFLQLKMQFREFLTGLTPQNAGRKLVAFIQNMRATFTQTLSGPGLSGIRQALTTIGAVISSMVGEMIKFVGSGVANAFRQAAAFIRNPDEFLRTMRAGAGAAGNGLMAAFAPLIDAIVEIAPVVWEAFKDLLSAAFDRLKTWVVGFAREHWFSIMAVLFAPTLISTGLAVVARTVVGALVGGVGGIFTNALGGIAGLLSRGGGGGIGGALSGISDAVSGAGGVGDAVSSSRSLTNPASIAKMLVAAAVIGVGLYLLINRLTSLSEELKAKKLTAADVGLAAITMGAAVAIMIGIAAAVPAISRAGDIIQSKAGAVIAATVAIGLVGTALAFGMKQLITLFSGVSIAQIGIASAAMVAAVGVAGVVGLAVAGLAIGGALLAGPQAVAIAAGMAAVGIVGTALAVGMLGLISLFSGINQSQINKVGSAMTTSLQIVASIAASTAILAGVGSLSALAPVVGVGMLAIVAIAGGLRLAIGAIIRVFERVNVGQLAATTIKVSFVTGLMTQLAGIGTVLAVTAAPLAIAERLGGVTSNSIKTIANNLFSAVSGLVRNASALPNGPDIQAKVGLFTNIVRTVIDFANSLRGLLETGSVFEGVGNRVRAINSLVRTITGQIGTAVNYFIQQASALPDVSAIQPKLGVITSIVTSFGNFARGITNIGTRDEDAISALTGFARTVFSGFTTFAQTAMPQIKQLIVAISTAAIGNVNVDTVRAFGEIINGVLGSVGSVVRSLGSIFTRQGGILENADDIATAAPAMGRAIGSLVNGLFGNSNLFASINQFISGLVTSVGGLATDQVEKVRAIGGILGPLFGAISAVSIAVAQIGQQTIRGDAGAFDRLRETISAIAGGISTEFSTLVTNLVSSLGRIDPGVIRIVQSSSVVLRGIFENITQMFQAVSSFGSEGGGTAASTTIRNAFRNIAEAIFGAGGEGWSFKSFIELFNPASGQLQALLTGLTASQGTFATLSQQLGAYKTGIQGIFGVVDEQFNNSLNDGLRSTLQHVNTTVQEIITTINQVHEQINQVGRSINVNAALANLGETIGTASPERLQIARGDLTINISVAVKLEVDDIEEAIAQRAGGSTFIVNKAVQGSRSHLNGAFPTLPG